MHTSGRKFLNIIIQRLLLSVLNFKSQSATYAITFKLFNNDSRKLARS